MIHYWEELGWQDFRAVDAARAVAVLPVAAIEQHGPHLPLGVDAMINRGVLAAALPLTAAATQLYVLPALPVGKSDEHAAFPGTLTLSAATLMQVWLEIGQSVARAGLRKIVLLNSHGGQPQIAQIVAQTLRMQQGMLAVVANTYGFGEPAGLWPAEEQAHGIHGGANETSLIQHLRPELVRLAALGNFMPASVAQEAEARELRFFGDAAMAWATQDLHESGACGDATLASAEAGEQILRHMAQRLAVLFDEVSAYPLERLREGPLPTAQP